LSVNIGLKPIFVVQVFVLQLSSTLHIFFRVIELSEIVVLDVNQIDGVKASLLVNTVSLICVGNHISAGSNK
jgi:hypothetical protein